MLFRSELIAAIRQEGDTRIGKRLRALLDEAGFAGVVGMATAGTEGDATIVRMNGAFWANYFTQAPFVEYALALGLTTAGEMAAISEAWKRWGNDPGAFRASFWCQAVGFKPV